MTWTCLSLRENGSVSPKNVSDKQQRHFQRETTTWLEIVSTMQKCTVCVCVCAQTRCMKSTHIKQPQLWFKQYAWLPYRLCSDPVDTKTSLSANSEIHYCLGFAITRRLCFLKARLNTFETCFRVVKLRLLQKRVQLCECWKYLCCTTFVLLYQVQIWFASLLVSFCTLFSSRLKSQWQQGQ